MPHCAHVEHVGTREAGPFGDVAGTEGVDLVGAIGVTLAAVDGGPRRGVEHEVGVEERRQRHVPLLTRQPARIGERLEQRVPELSRGTRDERAQRFPHRSRGR